ncbi:hypothetical protein EDC17_10322 [Sphingobacterium alimentarium]|uniref:Uncharacterized protein n=1 Tax=Sphingobacterium alimentarium TaxID=797292 RepID=A0A4R3VY37_9SPHI|nr:hypothetical protein EDC17_10322 [Sphingobacterium alimentarium]
MIAILNRINNRIQVLKQKKQLLHIGDMISTPKSVLDLGLIILKLLIQVHLVVMMGRKCLV